MKQKLVLKKKLIKPAKSFRCGCFKFKHIKQKPINKSKFKNKVFKKGKNIKTQVVIKMPKSVIQPRKKVEQKFLKTRVNQLNLIGNYKQKLNLGEPLKSKNVFYLNKKQNGLLSFLYLLLIGLFIGFVNGFWGGGGGMICVPTLTTILKLPEKKAHATAILIMLPLSIASFIVYLIKGTIDWGTAIYVTGGFVIGGILGALLLKKINNTVLKIVFSLVIIAGAIKLLI